MARRARAEWFAKELQGELQAKGWGVRTLARHWRPQSVEPSRRALHRYLAGEHLPQQAIRVELAEILGLPGDRFEPDEEDEDEALADLLFALDRFVHDRIGRMRHEAIA
jgi:hypothetical protein